MLAVINEFFIAMSPAKQPGVQPTAPTWTNFVPLVIMMFLLYYVMIRPQQQKAKQHATLLESLKAGDQVVTTGGIIGTVVSMKENTVSIRSSDNKLEIQKSAVSQVLQGNEKKKNGV
jgi:preprotein translocase subunit YajC